MRLQTTRKIVKSFLTYPQVKFTYPITGITNNEKSLIVFIDMEKLGEEEFKDFAVSKTDMLLSIIDKIENIEGNDNVEINLDDDMDIVITSDKLNQKIRKSPINLFQNVNHKSVDLVKEQADKVIETKITKEELSSILDIAKTVQNDTLILKDNKVITGKLFNKTLENDNEFTLDNGTFESEIKLDINHFYKLPKIDYKIEVYELNKDGQNIRLAFLTPKDIDGVLVIISEKLY